MITTTMILTLLSAGTPSERGHLAHAEEWVRLAQYESKKHRMLPAEQLLRRALLERTAQLGADHPLVKETRTRLAVLLGRQGRNAEAAALFKENQPAWDNQEGK